MTQNFDSIQIGDQLPSRQFDAITQLKLIKYAGASGDFNPIHTIPEYAREAGLDHTIAHGMLIMGMLGSMVSDWAGLKQVQKYGVSFKNMTRLGDVLTAKGEIKNKYEKDGLKLVDCNVYMVDQNNEVKIEGKATIRFN